MGFNDWTPVNILYEMLSGEPHPYVEKTNGQNIIVYGDNIMEQQKYFRQLMSIFSQILQPILSTSKMRIKFQEQKSTILRDRL